MTRTVAQVLASLPRPQMAELPAPAYTGTRSSGIMLAVESMRRHSTDEGHEMQQGLEHADYTLFGHGYSSLEGSTDVPAILRACDPGPGVVVVQDQREWEGFTADHSRDPRMRFTGIGALRERDDVFKVTVLKDAHSRPAYHAKSAEDMGCHAWVVPYDPRIIHHLAPFTRPRHIIRTWHTLDRASVPVYSPRGRGAALFSGAVSGAYPLRQAIVRGLPSLQRVDHLPHPGYGCRRCMTPEYLRTLSRYKVSIATSSRYSYALRKIIEATACGCVVVTDLASDDVMPEVDGNLVRVDPDIQMGALNKLMQRLASGYDPARQEHFAGRAIKRYDWRAVGIRLADGIEDMRASYNDQASMGRR